jgi:head decoration protein D
MAFITEGPRPLDMIVSEAQGSRSRDAVTITGDELLPPGTLLSGEVGGDFAPAGGAGDVSAILLYWADPRETPASATVLTRDCEVNDAYLVYGDFDRVAVATSLREHGIIVRTGVLMNPATDFAMSAEPWPTPPGAAATAAAKE